MSAPKRQYSRRFATTGRRRALCFQQVPAGFVVSLKAKARREGVSLRALVLDHLAAYLRGEVVAMGPPRQNTGEQDDDGDLQQRSEADAHARTSGRVPADG